MSDDAYNSHLRLVHSKLELPAKQPRLSNSRVNV